MSYTLTLQLLHYSESARLFLSLLPGGGNIEGCPRVRSAAAVIRQWQRFPRPPHWKSPLWPRISRSPALHSLPHNSLPFSSQNALRAAAEAKVGCLSLSWQPAVEERHLTSASSPPSHRVIILRLVSSRMMTTSARFHMLNTLFMELVNALIDGAAKKGLMMTASQPLLHLHCTNTYIYGTQIHRY